jgi:hypothetical protein
MLGAERYAARLRLWVAVVRVPAPRSMLGR